VGIYYVELADVLSAAGVQIGVNSQNAGWESRARGSGGFPSTPKGVFWHHTASQTSIENDLAWQCHGCDDAPVGNMTIDRNGVAWPVAAGASNCAGAGGPASFSRGTIAKDSGNTGGWNIEVANNGVGEPWPVAQVDSYFLCSNALNAHFGNQPDDIITHSLGHGDGWTDRKIDPAKAGAVQGMWVPRGTNGSSDTWVLADIKAECIRRAQGPGPDPDPDPEEDDVKYLLIQAADGSMAGALAVAPPDLSRMFFLSTGGDHGALAATGNYSAVVLSGATFERIPGAEQIDIIEGAP